MEHVQPINRPLSSRPTTFALAMLLAVSLMVVGGLVLLFQATGTRPAANPSSAPAAGRQTATPPAQPLGPLHPRAHTSVVVLNGNGISGAAGREATAILARGYEHAVSADAPNLDYARSLILFRPGWQREAQRLARDAKIPAVAPLDGRVAPAYAHVPLIVILGSN